MAKPKPKGDREHFGPLTHTYSPTELGWVVPLYEDPGREGSI
jgi:hypothetical protein